MASEKTIEIVKSTAPVLKEHGETITKVFYKRLFENHPELKNIFNMTHQKKGTQPKVLASTILQYATYIDQLDKLGDAVGTIAQKHSSLAIKPEMYPIVGKNLLAAIKEVLGEAATPEIIDAWAEAYGDLSKIFINVEDQIYQQNESSEGGFRGKKPFKVARKIMESKTITSIYLTPVDGSPIPNYLPGQYIAITLDIAGHAHKHTRNYSLSDYGNTKALRISVKKELGDPDGVVSNYLHEKVQEGDILEIGMPSGDFTLKESSKPVVLIAGGVGITPLISMYKSLKGKGRKTNLIQCTPNSATRPFGNEIQLQDDPNLSTIVGFSDPLASDKKGENYDFEGLLTEEILKSQLPEEPAEVYFCGPTPFMRLVLKLLNNLGVKEENIFYEFFGPAEELLEEEATM
ncbi:NO-inducible flavohemoprotein [Echinicola jeungdonensis]|uniref:nitric oxide dioxygenase n=1 Tax=Echinicola jeungdonensis TaxID=709343 RepID=A0ABV5J5C8_9BACT|nr:NO-inducible flavohemoprotein [Echinicola jeungdonensis]MDN3667996.1 NO-inducible flavohemoprotein [Echinicola jeungdonensis]